MITITKCGTRKRTRNLHGNSIIGNQAFTLIEVLVTVIIIGIVSGISLLGFHYMNNINAFKCAKQLSVILDKTRMESMGMVKDSIFLRVVKDDNSYYSITYRTVTEGEITTEIELDKVKLGSDALTICYIKDGMEEVVTKGQPLTIQFTKDSGSIKGEISEIKIVGRKTSKILLVKETGRNYLKQEG